MNKHILGALALILTLCFISSAAVINTDNSEFNINYLSSDESRPAPTSENYSQYDEFSISTVEEMNAFAVLTNSSSGNTYYTFTDKIVYLTADLDYTNKTNTVVSISSSRSYQFAGIFDGQGHKISNHTNEIFGYNSGCIINLGSVCNITKSSNSAGIVQINNGIVSNCYNSGNISVSSNIAGGVVGTNNGTISYCFNTGSVETTYNSGYAGGIAGYNSLGTIENCYNTGAVSEPNSYAGGIAGINWDNLNAIIKNCYSIGEVAGETYGGITTQNYAKIINSYCLNNVNRLVSYNYGTIDNDGTQDGVVNAETLKEKMLAIDSVFIADVDSINSGYPLTIYQNGLSPVVVKFKTDVSNDKIPIQVIPPTSKVIRPEDISKEGHVFEGWYSDMEYTSEYNFNEPIDSNTTIYAKWSKNIYTVTFDTNGGSAVDPIQLEYMDEVVIPDALPVRDGYIFAQWVPIEGTYNLGNNEEILITSDLKVIAFWYPKFSPDFPAPTVGSYHESQAFNISTVEEMEEFFNSQLVGCDYSRKIVYLAADLDYTGKTHLPGGTFKGIFDGNGHVIRNLIIESIEGDKKDRYCGNIGLFAHVDNGTIKNLGIEDSYFFSDYKSQRIASFGIYFRGVLENCYSAATIKSIPIMLASSSVSIYGLVDEGTVKNCYFAGDIIVENKTMGCYLTALGGQLTNCYCSGNLQVINDPRVSSGITDGSNSYILEESVDLPLTQDIFKFSKSDIEMKSQGFADLMGDAYVKAPDGFKINGKEYNYPVLKWQVYGIPDDSDKDPAADSSKNGSHLLWVYIVAIAVIVAVFLYVVRCIV